MPSWRVEGNCFFYLNTFREVRSVRSLQENLIASLFICLFVYLFMYGFLMRPSVTQIIWCLMTERLVNKFEKMPNEEVAA